MVAQLGDPRFEYRPHPRNLGGTATFNLFFRATAEPFYAMLEDDNAWAPAFLATMLAVAERHPDVTVFWSNQRLGREEADGSVSDAGATVHPVADPTVRRVAWGQPEQIFGAMHAHSAALFRSRAGDVFATPAVPIALVEAFRERLFPHPLVYVPAPLADFTITRATARSQDRGEWAVLQTMLAATFLKHAGYDRAQLAARWHDARMRRPPATNTLLFASLAEPACRALHHGAQPRDWLRFARGALRRPSVLPRVLRSRTQHADWWQFLDDATAARFAGPHAG